MFFNLNKLKKQLNNEEFDEEVSMVIFKAFKNHFQKFITKQISMDVDDQMANMFFTSYTFCDAQMFQIILIRQMDSLEKFIAKRALHKRSYDNKVNKRMMQTQEGEVNMVKDKCDAGLVVMESSGTVLEKQDERRRVDQDAEQRLDKRPLLASESGEKKNLCENAKCELQIKIVKLEKVLTQQTKDFDDVKLELSNRTAKFEVYFEKLENTKVVLERQLAQKIDDSKAEKDQLLKEINLLRTQLDKMKGKYVETKFDKPLILGRPPADKLLITSKLSKLWFTPKLLCKKICQNQSLHSLCLKMKKIKF
ncbi:hypothetical protein Tco_0382814 [Tanacetum coccineum]